MLIKDKIIASAQKVSDEEYWRGGCQFDKYVI